MGEIVYLAGSELKLDHELGQKVFDLIRTSSRLANESSNTYDTSGLEATFEEYEPENVWKKVDPLITSYFAFDRDKLVGTAFLSNKDCQDLPEGTGAYLNGLYVSPEYWGTDVAPTLLAKTLDYSRQNGIKVIRGNSTAYPNALKFYEKHGFRLGDEVFWEVLPGVRLKYRKVELDLTK